MSENDIKEQFERKLLQRYPSVDIDSIIKIKTLKSKYFSYGSTEIPDSKPIFGGTAAFGTGNTTKTPVTNIFGGNTNGDNKPSTGFSFTLPASTTLTPITAKESPGPQTPSETSTPLTTEEPAEQKIAAPMFSSSGMSFADLAKNTNANDTSPAFASSGVSFATLAQNNSNGSPDFGKSSSTGGFIGLSNKDTFSNLMQPKNTVNGTAQDASKDEDNENAPDDVNYDPHYDPIIALPDEIQVSTGEENEVKLFGERAKLYRFDSDNKEVRIFVEK